MRPNRAIFKSSTRRCKLLSFARRVFTFVIAFDKAKRLICSQTWYTAFSSSTRIVACFDSSKRVMSSSARSKSVFAPCSAVTTPWARISAAFVLATSSCSLALASF